WITDELGHRTGATLRERGDPELAIPPHLQLKDGMSVDDAVAIALWNNATFQADLTQLGIARGDLVEAGVLPNPILTLLFPVGSKPLEFALKQPVGALWQRPRKVAAARKEAERVAGSLVQRGLD